MSKQYSVNYCYSGHRAWSMPCQMQCCRTMLRSARFRFAGCSNCECKKGRDPQRVCHFRRDAITTCIMILLIRQQGDAPSILGSIIVGYGCITHQPLPLRHRGADWLLRRDPRNHHSDRLFRVINDNGTLRYPQQQWLCSRLTLTGLRNGFS